MKTFISIILLLVSLQEVKAQENTVKKDFLFENPATKEKIMIETGNTVAIRFKSRGVRTMGTILSLSDSSLILGVRQEPYRMVVPFWNIAEMKVIVVAKKRYGVRLTLKNRKVLTGELADTGQNSVSILNDPKAQPVRVELSEIQSIRIRNKKNIWISIAIGAGTGALVGGIIGNDSYHKGGCQYGPFCNDYGPGPRILGGAVVGGVVGGLTGMIVGSFSGKKFKIEGNQAQFDLFANEFK